MGTKIMQYFFNITINFVAYQLIDLTSKSV